MINWILAGVDLMLSGVTVFGLIKFKSERKNILAWAILTTSILGLAIAIKGIITGG